jgi:hypothetical protein
MSDPFYRTAQWRRLRAAALMRDPVCVTPGCSQAARVADHIVPRRQGGADSLDNLRCLCIECHNQRSHGGEPTVRGCDAAGKPNDPTHWWNRPRLQNRSGLTPANRRPPARRVSSDQAGG